MLNKGRAFNDTWILIIGIPLVGIIFPFIFGARWGEPTFFKWILISTLTTLVSWLATRRIVSLIWIKFPWETDPFLHIAVGILLLIICSMLTVGMLYGLNVLLFKVGPEYWKAMKPIRTGVFLAYALITLTHETIHLFYKWKKELTHAADLEKENMRSKFEALKNHINPHFLFNSLGTLSSLIRTDAAKAEKYVNEFASIYRYFLQVNSNDLVTVEEELDFINSYVFLQQIRFGDGFTYTNRVHEACKVAYILPLTLELLVENALKHNTTLPASPLRIEIYADKEHNQLVVTNNYQPRPPIETPCTGLHNLEQRYESYTGKRISYGRENTLFQVKIPLIQPDS